MKGNGNTYSIRKRDFSGESVCLTDTAVRRIRERRTDVYEAGVRIEIGAHIDDKVARFTLGTSRRHGELWINLKTGGLFDPKTRRCLSSSAVSLRSDPVFVRTVLKRKQTPKGEVEIL